MLGRWTTVLVATGLALGGTALSAPAATAADDDDCTLTDVTPHIVVIGLGVASPTFRVKATGCTVSTWAITTVDTDETLADSTNPRPELWPNANSLAGYHDLTVELHSEGGHDSYWTVSKGVDLKRRTTWKSGSFNASPEPAKKGAKITVAGTLLRADWYGFRYDGYSGRNVSVQFKPAGGAWAQVATATSDSKGRVTAKVKAKATGAWRLVYGGNTTAGPATSPSDSVKVTG